MSLNVAEWRSKELPKSAVNEDIFLLNLLRATCYVIGNHIAAGLASAHAEFIEQKHFRKGKTLNKQKRIVANRINSYDMQKKHF